MIPATNADNQQRTTKQRIRRKATEDTYSSIERMFFKDEEEQSQSHDKSCNWDGLLYFCGLVLMGSEFSKTKICLLRMLCCGNFRREKCFFVEFLTLW